MTKVAYLGALTRGPDGRPRLERPRITPPPSPRLDDRLSVPPPVWRAIAGGRGFLARILGDSMQPGILDNDVAVVLRRAPKDRDVVVVRTDMPHPVYGPVTACVWRYHAGFLTKDNAACRAQRPVTPDEIMGVVANILPRERRNELEHYARIQEIMAIERALGITSADLGFYRQSKHDAFGAVVTIPTTELIDGRLPWGYFRATAKADHPHIGIHAGDILTIDATPDAKVSQLVIEQLGDGAIIIGVLQRERLHEKRPGELFIDLGDRRVYVTEDNGHMPVSHTFGVIAQHERLA